MQLFMISVIANYFNSVITRTPLCHQVVAKSMHLFLFYHKIFWTLDISVSLLVLN